MEPWIRSSRIAGSVAAARNEPMYRGSSASKLAAATHRVVFICFLILPRVKHGSCQCSRPQGKPLQCSLSVSPLMSRLSSTSMETMPTAVNGGTASPTRAMNHR